MTNDLPSVGTECDCDSCKSALLVSQRDELASRVRELEKALCFYASIDRYHGANQRAIGDSDPFTAKDAPYMQDVTRDRGGIARAALNASKEQP